MSQHSSTVVLLALFGVWSGCSNAPGSDVAQQAAPLSAAAADVMAVGYPTASQVGMSGTFNLIAGAFNAGPDAAADVVVVATLPAEATVLSVTRQDGTPAPCTVSGASLICSYPTMALYTEEDAVIAIQAPPSLTTLSFNVHVSASSSDPAPGNNDAAQVDVQVIDPLADLLVFLFGPTQVASAGAMRLDITAVNFGPTDATGVVVTYAIPPGASIVSTATGSLSCSASLTELRCDVGLLALWDNRQLSLTLAAPDAVGSILSSVVTVSADTPDPNVANNSASLDTQVVAPSADLSVSLSGPSSVGISDPVTLSINVVNFGPTSASGVSLAYPIPPGATLVSTDDGSGQPCAETVDLVTCDLGALAYFEGRTVTVVLTAPAAAVTMTSRVTVSSTTTDPEAANDSSTLLTLVLAPSADLYLTTGVWTPQVTTGGTVSFNVGVINAGPTAADAVTLQVTLPAGLNVSVQPTQPGSSCTVTATDVTCSVPRLEVFHGLEVQLTAQAPTTTTTLTFDAKASSTTPDPLQFNNNTTIDIPVLEPSADLVAFLFGPSTAFSPGTASYFVDMANIGPTDAIGAQVAFTLPPGASLVSASGGSEPCTVTGDQVICPLGTIYVNWHVLAFFEITTPDQPGTMTAVATVSAETPDPNPDNNASPVTTDLVVPTTNMVVFINAPSLVAVSTPVSLSFAVYNFGAAPARDVTLAATLPDGLVHPTITLDGGPAPCTLSGTQLTCALGTFTSYQGSTITVSATAPATAASATILATVTTTTEDTNPSDNTATFTIDFIPPSADLVLVPQSVKQTTIPGAAAGMVIYLTNQGPTAADHVTFTITLPPGSTDATIQGIENCTVAGPSITCALSGLAVYDQRFIGLTFRAPMTTGSYAAQLEITSDTPDPVPANNRVPMPFDVVAQNADLGVRITQRPLAVAATDGVQVYDIFVDNHGPTIANGVLTVTRSDNAVWFSSNECKRETINGPIYTCPLDFLGVADAYGATVTLYAKMPANPGTVTVVATVSAQGDPNPANDTATVSTTVVPPSAELAVTATGPAFAASGDPLIYDVEVVNNGPLDARQVLLTETLPEGAVVQSVYATYRNSFQYSQIQCDITANVVTCGTFQVDADRGMIQLHVEATAPAGLPGPLTSTATVSSQTAERDPTNDTATVVTQRIEPSADLAVTMTGPDKVITGDGLGYRIDVQALGPTSAHDVVLTDVFPAGTTAQGGFAFIGFDYRTCSVNGNTVSCDLGVLRPGQAAQVQTFGAAPPTAGTVTNTVQVSSSTPDPFPASNTATATTIVAAPFVDLSLALLTQVPKEVATGSVLDLQWHIANAGNIYAQQVELTITLPPGARPVSCPMLDGCPGNVVTYGLGYAAPGYEYPPIMTPIFLPSTAGRIHVTGTIQAAQADQNPKDNSATFVTKVVVPTVDLDVELASKPPKSVVPGAAVLLSWRVRNRGAWPATGVTLALAGPDAACPSPDGCVRALDPLAPGASAGVQTLVTAPTKLGKATYTATVAAQEKDTDPGNDTARAELRVVAPADLTVAVAPSSGTGLVAGAESYRVTVKNLGPGAGRALATIDLGGAAAHPLDGLVASSSRGSCQVAGAGTRVACTIDELKKGEAATVTLDGRLVTPPGGLFTLGAAVTEPDGLETNLANNHATFSGSVTAPPLVVRCHDVTVNAGADCNAEASIDDGSSDPLGGTPACVQAPAGPYPLGTTQVMLTCARAGGDPASCGARVKVVDNSPPAVVCPATASLECVDEGATDVFSAQASDNCGKVTVTCDPASGSFLPEGQDSGTCVARDGAGNRSRCSFTARVVDTLPPVVATNAGADGVSKSYWPVDGKLRKLSLSDCVTAVADKCDGALDIAKVGKITRITSDEGGPSACTDAVITSDTTALLRAAQNRTNGRVYTVFFTASDDEGNRTESSCRIAVPLSRDGIAVADGPAVCVGAGCGTVPTCP